MFNKNCRSKFLKNLFVTEHASCNAHEMNRAWCRTVPEGRLQDVHAFGFLLNHHFGQPVEARWHEKRLFLYTFCLACRKNLSSRSATIHAQAHVST